MGLTFRTNLWNKCYKTMFHDAYANRLSWREREICKFLVLELFQNNTLTTLRGLGWEEVWWGKWSMIGESDQVWTRRIDLSFILWDWVGSCRFLFWHCFRLQRRDEFGARWWKDLLGQNIGGGNWSGPRQQPISSKRVEVKKVPSCQVRDRNHLP